TPEALVEGVTDPQVVPLHPVPDTDHVTPLFAGSPVTAALNDCVPPATTLAVVKDKLTATAGAAVVTVTALLPDLLVSVTEVAVRVTPGGFGGLAGAV